MPKIGKISVPDPMGNGFCKCGCGAQIPHRKMFVNSIHYRRYLRSLTDAVRERDRIVYRSKIGEKSTGYEKGWGICQCGCGEKTSVRGGKAARYRLGHASRSSERRLAQSLLAVETHRIYPLLQRERFGRSISGLHQSQKLKRDVPFMSLYEERAFQILDSLPEVETYLEQPFAIPYRFGEQEHRYVPDILVFLSNGSRVLIEVKPASRLESQRIQAKHAAAAEFCAMQGMFFLIWTEQELFKTENMHINC